MSMTQRIWWVYSSLVTAQLTFVSQVKKENLSEGMDGYVPEVVMDTNANNVPVPGTSTSDMPVGGESGTWLGICRSRHFSKLPYVICQI